MVTETSGKTDGIEDGLVSDGAFVWDGGGGICEDCGQEIGYCDCSVTCEDDGEDCGCRYCFCPNTTIAGEVCNDCLKGIHQG